MNRLGFIALLLHLAPLPVHHPGAPNGRWFNELRSHSGAVCCSGSDGEVITDADWESYQGRYRVRIDGRWIVVEPWAVVDTPNIDGRTVVWPYRKDGIVIIRCFMPGTMI